jgi:hypothetical protein
MKVTIENGELVIRMQLQAPRPSASGKTLVVATSSGCVKTEAKIDGKTVTVGVNAFIHKD